MKHQLFISAMACCLLFSSCGNGGKQSDAALNEEKQSNTVLNGDEQNSITLNNDLDSLSYAIGIDLGEQLANNPQGFNLAIVSQAIKDVNDSNVKMTRQDAIMFMQTFQQKEYERQMQQSSNPEALKQLEEKNKAAGEKYLADNKNKAGVVTLPSGLQYKIIKKGTGPKPKATDVVEVHYKGTLIDGTEFDSSYGSGETATFPLSGVIKGWTEGLQHINEGSTVIFYIPQELAYGATPRPGGPIEPYMALIFEIELIKVTPQN